MSLRESADASLTPKASVWAAGGSSLRSADEAATDAACLAEHPGRMGTPLSGETPSRFQGSSGSSRQVTGSRRTVSVQKAGANVNSGHVARSS